MLNFSQSFSRYKRHVEIAFGLTLLVGIAAAEGKISRCSLAGVVQDQTGAVIANAEVEVAAGRNRILGKTSDQGVFEFADLPAAPTVVTVRAPGFAETRQELQLDGERSINVVLTPETHTEQVVVTASRTPEAANQIAEQVLVKDREDLLATAAPTLDDALRQVPGLTLFRRSGSRTANPTSQGVSMRGVGASGASRAVVLHDGVPLNDPFGGWVYWGRIPRESIQSVEVLSGGASHLYGSDALGGVVNVIAARPTSTSLALETFMGTETTPDVSLQAGLRTGPWLTLLSGEVFATNGYVAVLPSQRGLVDTPVASRHGSANLSLDRLFGDSGRIFGSGGFYRESRNNGTPLQTNETELFDVSGGVDRPTWGGFLTARLYGGGETFLQNFSAISLDRSSESLTRKQHVPVQQLGGSVQWSRALGTSNMLSAGFDARQVKGLSDEVIFAGGSATADTAAGGRQRIFGLFLHDSFRLHPRLTLTAGGRFDFWQNYDAFSARVPIAAGASSFTGFGDRDAQSFSPRLSLLYRASDHVAFTASGYRAFRAPTLNELYRNFRVGNILTQANENLAAEHLAGGEGGVRVTAGKVRINSVFFWTIVTGAIANRTLSTTPTLITRQRQNLGRTQSRGVDVNAEFPITSSWAVSAGYEFADATVLHFAPDPTLEGLLIPQTPRHTFTFQTRYSQLTGWTLALQARASDKQFEDDQNLLPLDGYATFDAFVSRHLNRNLELFAAGENLLNRHYMIGRTPVVTLGPPILGRFGLRLQLAQR